MLIINIFRNALIFLRITNMYKQACVHRYVYYSNVLDLRKIEVAQALSKRKDCVSLGASGLVIMSMFR
jgi:hypothetical protein